MTSLPHNIERRLFARGLIEARYRGWDAASRMYHIFGQSGRWAARCRAGEQLPLFADTLAQLSDKLGARA
ncbi:hypothetical protein UFOVP4_34 [uncultured Caudovirales phage]|uniref:Uncharacterized protein n=1 Tax=uncultured Caudovirales phage TaxID=2100421 RepID=A0A6J5KIF9_9CAUD|nr:hypothetical protein UFOVP4_34 [uncultured Caudovirales phage]CAB4241273.1 hypothetical protein UFOVP64_26 [uncultured Caudovirales phage]CAB5078999.1 hypothetical protein UFOVP145_40 [uncultured Caudovirales phage]